MEDRKVIMQVENLNKEFVIHGKKLMEPKKMLHALSDVSFEIYEGETLGIIGESGCGKSTLGRCLVQLHKPTSGTILYKGEDLWQMTGEKRRNARRNIQMIFQDPYSSLDPRKTASYSIEEAMKVHGLGENSRERHQRALEALQEVGLDVQHMERYPHEFSGGQRQRVNIARALSISPELIVCDEPVSALDVSIQAQVINLFKKIQQERKLTYVFISHDLGIIKYISDWLRSSSSSPSSSCIWDGSWRPTRPMEFTPTPFIPTRRRFCRPFRRRAPLRRRRECPCTATSPAPSGIRWAVLWPAAAPTVQSGARRRFPS